MTNLDDRELSVKDIVRLATNDGPNMVVSEIDGGKRTVYVVYWHGEQLHQERVPMAALRRVSESELHRRTSANTSRPDTTW